MAFNQFIQSQNQTDVGRQVRAQSRNYCQIKGLVVFTLLPYTAVNVESTECMCTCN